MTDVGFRRWLALQYTEVSDTRAVIGLAITDEMRNMRGVAHGGIVASLADIAMGTAASGGDYESRSRLVVTLEMKLNFVGAADGAYLEACADVVHLGSRTIVVKCDVRTSEQKTCAVGLGTFIVRRPHPNDPSRFRDAG